MGPQIKVEDEGVSQMLNIWSQEEMKNLQTQVEAFSKKKGSENRKEAMQLTKNIMDGFKGKALQDNIHLKTDAQIIEEDKIKFENMKPKFNQKGEVLKIEDVKMEDEGIHEVQDMLDIYGDK